MCACVRERDAPAKHAPAAKPSYALSAFITLSGVMCGLYIIHWCVEKKIMVATQRFSVDAPLLKSCTA